MYKRSIDVLQCVWQVLVIQEGDERNCQDCTNGQTLPTVVGVSNKSVRYRLCTAAYKKNNLAAVFLGQLIRDWSSAVGVIPGVFAIGRDVAFVPPPQLMPQLPLTHLSPSV